MASSSSVPESSMRETPAYEIRGRTMSLEEWDLNVQVKNPIDFTSLAHHDQETSRLEHKFMIAKLLNWRWMKKF